MSITLGLIDLVCDGVIRLAMCVRWGAERACR